MCQSRGSCIPVSECFRTHVYASQLYDEALNFWAFALYRCIKLFILRLYAKAFKCGNLHLSLTEVFILCTCLFSALLHYVCIKTLTLFVGAEAFTFTCVMRLYAEVLIFCTFVLHMHRISYSNVTLHVLALHTRRSTLLFRMCICRILKLCKNIYYSYAALYPLHEGICFSKCRIYRSREWINVWELFTEVFISTCVHRIYPSLVCRSAYFSRVHITFASKHVFFVWMPKYSPSAFA